MTFNENDLSRATDGSTLEEQTITVFSKVQRSWLHWVYNIFVCLRFIDK